MEIPEKLILSDLISRFAGRIDTQTVPPPPKETVNIADRITLKQNLNTGARDLWDAFKATDYETAYQVNWDKITRRYQLLLKREVDKATPLTLFSMKARIKEADAPEEERLFLDLIKGELPDGDTEALFKANQLRAQDQSREVGGMAIRIGENDLEVIDRLVSPQYREQGIGRLLLDMVEAMAEKEADDVQTSQRIHAETAQLDVICWLWNQGYRPSTREDQVKLDAILCAAPDLRIGENLYVFPETIPSSERLWSNFKSAFRLRLEKIVQPKGPKDIERQRAVTRGKIRL